MDTLVTQLERVQKAIAAIEEGAQEYQIGTRKLTKGDLATLYGREADLKAAIAAQNGGTITFAQMGML
ncbi:hypothetical protein [Pelorhabdus rhamnosifermentans]|uniref:hypothetical protein n=1 Tax=Pelorhabdus rhamnosifermentans TaxID=2772457 RepID=UPI001C064589|nr:hypothetical protein [Pelorhabdus rhamnosifermentans]